jgi:quercetin dioxygenase-like cupin family protein
MDESVVVVAAPTEGPIPDDARVASQTVLSTPSLRIVEIALGSGAELTEHSAPAPILVQVLEGEVAFKVAGGTHLLRAPGFVHLPHAGERHRVSARLPARIQITMLLGAARHSEADRPS